MTQLVDNITNMVTGDGDIAGIRIIPPIVEFVDASQNEVYSAKFTVQNVSKFGKRLRFHPPVTEVRFLHFMRYTLS